MPRAARQTAAVRPVRGLRCTRCAQRSAVVRRRGARRASGLMQLCPRCFRDLRASETACGRGWRARRARATHSRLDGSKRSVVRGPLKSPALVALLAAKMMPLILGHLLCIDQYSPLFRIRSSLDFAGLNSSPMGSCSGRPSLPGAGAPPQTSGRRAPTGDLSTEPRPRKRQEARGTVRAAPRGGGKSNSHATHLSKSSRGD